MAIISIEAVLSRGYLKSQNEYERYILHNENYLLKADKICFALSGDEVNNDWIVQSSGI
jgi:hypothetical protein